MHVYNSMPAKKSGVAQLGRTLQTIGLAGTPKSTCTKKGHTTHNNICFRSHACTCMTINKISGVIIIWGSSVYSFCIKACQSFVLHHISSHPWTLFKGLVRANARVIFVLEYPGFLHLIFKTVPILFTTFKFHLQY